MDKTDLNADFEEIKKKRKPLGLTFIILLLLGILLFLIRSCETENALVKSSLKTDDVELGNDMEKLVFKIQNCSRLYTTEYKIHKIVTHEDQKVLKMGGLKIEIPLTDRHIAIPMDVTLKAYVDLGTFSENSIKTDGEHILITLPDPHIEVTSTMVDHDNTLIHNSFIRSNYTAKEQEQLHRQGLKSITDNILETDILENAKLSATRTLVPMITRMGYKEENIRISFSKEKFNVADLSRLIDTNNATSIQSKRE